MPPSLPEKIYLPNLLNISAKEKCYKNNAKKTRKIVGTFKKVLTFALGFNK